MPVRPRHLGLLVGSQIGSAVGSSVSAFGGSLWVFQETGSATLLALVFLAGIVPGIAVGVHAGGVVDRFDRRVVMLAADAVAATATISGVILFATGVLAWGHVVAIAATVSFASAFQEPAYTAALPELASTRHLSRVNGAVQLGPALALIAGPALGGALVATHGLGAVFAVDLVTFAVAVAVLAAIRFPSSEVERATATGDSIAEGWQALRERPGLLLLTGLAGGVNFLFGFVNVLLLPLVLGFADESTAGVVLGVAGIGMLGGSILMSTWAGPSSRVRAISTGVAVLGLGVVGLSLSPSPVLVAISLGALMGAVPLVSTCGKTLSQLAVPDRLRGRIFGIRRAVATAAMPVSYVLAGPLADGIFEPALSEHGALATSLGRLVGTGEGRGVAALFLLCGVGVLVLAAVIRSSRALADLETAIDREQATLRVEGASVTA